MPSLTRQQKKEQLDEILAGLEKIIEAGIQAPSGENSQPWRFVLRYNEILVYNRPERDQSLYNWAQRGSLVSHGACIENMTIAAESFGYDLVTNLFPDKNNLDWVARIELKPKIPKPHALYPYIANRATNRKLYESLALSNDEERELREVKDSKTHITFITDPKERMVIADAVALGDRVLFENRALHDFFFNHVNWTHEEDQKKKVGFFLDTLELPPPARKGFKLFKHWPLAKLLGLFGVTKKIASDNAKIYASGGALALISRQKNTPEDFVMAGRAMEHLWLTATKLGLYCQPMTAVLFFMHRIIAGEADVFSYQHRDLIKKAHKIISSLVVNQSVAIMLLRIGRAEPPSARSLRFPVRDFIET